MDGKFYPFYHAIRKEDYEAWEAFRLTVVLTLCGKVCMEPGNRNLVYDLAHDFYEAPYKILFRDMNRPVSHEEDNAFIKCPNCWAELPMVLLGDLP